MYPSYTVVPVTGVTKQLGAAPAVPVSPTDQVFCTEEDAAVILKIFLNLGFVNAKLVNAAVTPVDGVSYSGVDPSSPAQPWYITGIPNPGPVGPALWIQYGPNSINGGGRGNPGSWIGILAGNPRYVPEQPPPPPLITPVADPNAANVFAQLQGANTDLAEVLRLIKAIAAKEGIQ